MTQRRTRAQELAAIALFERQGRIRRLRTQNAPRPIPTPPRTTLSDALDASDWIEARHHLNRQRQEARRHASGG